MQRLVDDVLQRKSCAETPALALWQSRPAENSNSPPLGIQALLCEADTSELALRTMLSRPRMAAWHQGKSIRPLISATAAPHISLAQASLNRREQNINHAEDE